ncbi:MAG: hypothetical protein COV34_00995 [Candidatus Zambryskibacteria bacterium CG10_big_fil_rev_8_21_14_0_10_42_12]|uniref:Glycosyl transferase family 1 domain-containing protein n=1 Tax=Candidatus Zambryskibacteria bacterium CG10_big_fil_rev_8_21_14_0_10_42_12 TaxID=1975115 RepID=A0A2H0QV72_9BACT|nr:MAG: hypothetical protein COV34_00995 [Candidatus Zambryskibacteria bacterium CG10_big_fil_rev_8_21_14_0_10_42_12]
MRLLILTQVVDRNDPVLGFFHEWINAFALHFESITVICLKKGVYNLPHNVRVFSLGKEEGKNRFTYVLRFFTCIISLRNEYDSVFVHMNQEYVLLGGIIWKIFRKRVSMWRNHHAGSFLTDIASFFCDQVFCTSKYSYTAKYKKIIFMPVGIDADVFYPRDVTRKNNTLLFIARIAPPKNLHLIIDALIILKHKGLDLELDVYGAPLPKDEAYFENIKQSVKTHRLQVIFHGPIKNTETPSIYTSHDICINMSSSGMYDKTIFEAMACGCLSIASNKNLVGLVKDIFIVNQDDAHDLAQKLETIVGLDLEQKNAYRSELRNIVVMHHSLRSLAEKIHTVLL